MTSVVPGSVLVVGCGSIGRRHLANLAALGARSLIAYDCVADRVDATARAVGARTADSLDAALAAKPAAVIVCTPADAHVHVASAALAADAHVFIEKPIAADADGVEDLIATAERRHRVLMVGYNLRFDPGLARLKALVSSKALGRVLAIHAEFGQYLPDWRPDRDYRDGYFGSAATGGGMLLDGSHELDYVRWLGEEVHSVMAMADHLSDLDGETEDVALVALRLASGGFAQVSLDCVQRTYARRCKVIGSGGTAVWELHGGLRLSTVESPAWRTLEPAHDVAETYRVEMAHFLACVRGEAAPHVDGRDALRVLRIALAARESAKRRCEVEL